ncbi:ARM repeat-containing protein [Xylaria arbuscula]|nr:ARM repeat-containing protein [Xylaria arbuscula]
MTATTRPNGFPSLAARPSQSQIALASRAWEQNIWRNNGSINSHRDTANSGASDEVSPTAPSASAQPTGWGIWSNTNTSPNNASPVHTKSSFSYTVGDGSHGFHAGRNSITHATSGISSRTVPPGPVENHTSLRHTAIGEERNTSGTYYTPGGSQYPSDVGASSRRKSAEPNLLTVHNRSSTFSNRQPEIDTSTLPPHYRGPTHSFSKGLQSNSEQRHPSISNASVSMTSEAARGQALNLTNNGTYADLNDSFRALGLEDTSESMNGYISNGYSSPSQQYQLDPTSQSWHHDFPSGSRNFSQGVTQETWDEVPHSSYSNTKRGSMERNSPAGSSYRPQLNSPRNMSGTPNSRATNAWNPPVPRNPLVSQEMNRQQPGVQYPNQPPAFYPPYYNSHPQYATSYDQYLQQTPNYRHQVPNYGFGMPLNSLGLPLQTSRGKDTAQGVRSPLLDEFRAQPKPNRRYELKEIYGHIVEFSGDQHGSRFIQDKLVVANSEEKERVFNELKDNAIQLMKDVFGNYVIQKFFEHGALYQKSLLALQMKGNITELSVQMYSCRVVQKALDHLLVEEQREIIDELRPSIVNIAKDQNGNHVIQRIIEKSPQHCIPFILDATQGQVEQLASHQFACRVIQRLLEFGTAAEKRRLMADIHTCTAKLLTDQYGNYVIQHIIGHGEPEDRYIMIQHVIERAVALSKHKFASNVVEKCIEFGTAAERNAIRAKLTTTSADGTNPLQLLMKDQFGNYVLQKMIEWLQGPEKIAFVSEIRAYLPLLKKQGAGRQNAGLDRLSAAVEASTGTSGTNGSDATAGTTPSSPSLAVEVNSAVPTPSLTTEQNSPQSSSPPSTNISTTDEGSEETKTAHVPRFDKAPALVHVQEN